MMRSLFAAVSGLRNHQVSMSVIGNNIANINTIGFKTGRAIFQQMLSDTIQGASRPTNGSAGTNPVQVGLGMSLGAISNNFGQGQLEATGNMMDMAVQGDGFFVMRNGGRQFYGRAGSFGLDGTGRLTAGQGLIVQGWVADASGNLGSGSGLVDDVVLPFGQKSPARATSTLTLQSNLDSSAEALNSILRTNAFRATAAAGDAIQDLFASSGQPLGAQAGDSLRLQYAATDAALVTNLATDAGVALDLVDGDTISVSDGSGSTTLTFDDAWTLGDLAAQVQAALATIGTETDVQVTVSPEGNLLFTNPAGGNNADLNVTLSVAGRSVFNSLVASVPVIEGTNTARSHALTVTQTLTNGAHFTNAGGLAAALQGALRLGSAGASVVFQNGRFVYDNSGPGAEDLQGIRLTRPGATTTFTEGMGLAGIDLGAGETTQSGLLLHTAVASDDLADLYTAQGTHLGLSTGDIFSFDALVGGTPLSPTTFTVAATGDGSSTDRAVQTLGGLMDELRDVLDLTTAGDVTLSDGALVVEGRSGLSRALGGLTFAEVGNAALGAGTAFTETQAATDVTHETSIRVFDSLGQTHLLSILFTKDNDTDNRWTWEAQVEDGSIVAGGSGAVTFRGDGSLESFTTDDGSPLQIEPDNGANGPMTIAFDAGTFGGVDGITGFARESTTAIVEQDGYTMGTLQQISIDADGVIHGSFSNGVSRALAQIALADFNNPAGLERDGASWSVTPNSGQPVIRRPGRDTDVGAISAGTLEMSNVDLAQEFTGMIVAQRGFQANARTVSTSDEMLQELVNLKR